MHELALTHSVLDLALARAQAVGARRVLAVNLSLAHFAHESEEALRLHWGLLSESTVADGAELRMRRMSVNARCADCGHSFAPESEPLLCPVCFSPRVTPDLAAVRVESIDVE